jgi:hypothetical protein
MRQEKRDQPRKSDCEGREETLPGKARDPLFLYTSRREELFSHSSGNVQRCETKSEPSPEFDGED